jgi:hypothetical protein
MADIDQIIAGGAGASSRADFSGLSKIFDSYYKGRDEFAKNDLRDAFKGGVPTLPDGSIDYATMQRTLYQKGALDQGNALSGISARAGELAALDRADGQAAPQTIVSPPSANRSASAVVAPPLNKGGVSQSSAPQASPGGDQPGSIVGAVSAAGIPDELAGPVIQQLSALAKTDPNAALPPDVAQRIQQVAQAAAQRMKTGQTPQPTGIQPQQAAPQAPPVMAQSQPAPPPQGFQPPPNVVAAQNDPILKRLTLLSASQDKQIAAAAKVRLESYLKDRELTGPLKEYQAATKQGFKGTFEDWQNRADENTTERDILTKSLLPKIDKSQETAVAARDDITAIHRSREELDQKGGVFSGAFADKKLYLAKVAEALGVPDAGAIKNTEAYGAAIGSRVASMVKAFGSGTAISDGDRRFAAAMAGGQVTLDEKSMRRILDIGEQAARGKIEQHNTLADKIVGANKAMKDARDTYIVQPPGAYKKPAGATATTATASTIASKADYDKLPVGSVFTGPDGKQWRKQ